MKQFKKTILIDLDGVLNRYEGKFDEQTIPPIKEGAFEFIEQLANNFELKLFTTRNKILATKWLIKNNIDKYFKDVTNIKIPSYLYIDDRTICFRGDYKKALNEIRTFKVYWKT